jgi:outer membrane lipoprotein-sorting protein
MKFIRKRIHNLIILMLTSLFVAGTVSSLNAQENLPGKEIIKKSQQEFFYPGNDFKAKVQMKLINKNGKERIRELTMLRLNIGEQEDQKYYMYFHQPADVREMTFMVWKYSKKNDDRWLYVPSIKLVRQIAANDKNSSFVGSDFSYEDVTGREIHLDEHTLKEENTINGNSAYVVESIPKDKKSTFFSRKVSWIDKSTFLPLKEEYYDKRGDLHKTFTAAKIETVQGIETIMQRTMTNNKNGHHTIVVFEKVKYNVGLKEDIFTERYLRNAPQEWIQ